MVEQNALDITGSLWFLFLLIPGLWLIATQFGRGSNRLSARRGSLYGIMGLQAAALILMVVSLLGPVLKHQRITFHAPQAIFAIDASSSFSDSIIPGTSARVGQLKSLLRGLYGESEIDLDILEFPELKSDDGHFPVLTDYSILAEEIESMRSRNLKAIFLASDGRDNWNASPKRLGSLGVPVFPLIWQDSSACETQALSAEIQETPDNGLRLQVDWTWAGMPKGETTFKILDRAGEKWSTRLEAGDTLDEIGNKTVRSVFSLSQEVTGRDALVEPLRLVLEPDDRCDRTDWNDTIAIRDKTRKGRNALYWLTPVQLLSEKLLAEHLLRQEDFDLKWVRQSDLGALQFQPGDLLWTSSGHLDGLTSHFSRMAEEGAHLVVYENGVSGGESSVLDYEEPLEALGKTAVVRAEQGVSGLFFRKTFSVKDISSEPLVSWKPSDRWTPLISSHGEVRRIVAARALSPQGLQVVRFSLPASWPLLFRTRPDEESRAAVSDFFQGIIDAAQRDWYRIDLKLPEDSHADLPFSAGARIPDWDPSGGGELLLVFQNEDGKWEHGLHAAGKEETRVDNVVLKAGRYSVRLVRDNETLVTDSLVVASREKLELGKIGQDRQALEQLANRTGGRLLQWQSTGSPDELKAPSLSVEQVKEIQESSVSLHNNVPLFLTTILLLAISWVWRKRLNLD